MQRLDLSILPIGSTPDRPRLSVGLATGFELLQAHQGIGAVDPYLEATATLSRELPDSHKDQIAAVMTGFLLLRSMN